MASNAQCRKYQTDDSMDLFSLVYDCLPECGIVLKLSAFQRNAVAGFPQMKVTQALQNLLNLKEIQ
jgi:uncharacterized protein YuzB (UPF0349 family)